MTPSVAKVAALGGAPERATRTLRLLSFNMQGGLSTHTYRHYITRGLDHVLPHPRKARSLRRVADVLAHFDLVALQEADSGSLRSGFVNQVQFLAEQSGFGYWSYQSNRRVGRVAESANGLLARIEPYEVLDHRLPGRIRGRGALEARFGTGDDGFRLVIAHLALSPRARRAQLAYLAEIIGQRRHVALAGDFNCTPESGELDELFARTRLHPLVDSPATFPSWRPRRAIDHILVGDGLIGDGLVGDGLVGNGAPATRADAVPLRVSDHLPIALTLEVPEASLRGPG